MIIVGNILTLIKDKILMIGKCFGGIRLVERLGGSSQLKVKQARQAFSVVGHQTFGHFLRGDRILTNMGVMNKLLSVK